MQATTARPPTSPRVLGSRRAERPAPQGLRYLPGERIVSGLQACDPLGGTELTERWLAWSAGLWSHVVVELPRDEHAEDLCVVRRLAREARLLRRLRHPSLPRLLHDAHDHPVPHLVLEHGWDVTLERAIVADGPLHPGDVVRLGLRLASCLHHVHAEGLVHLGIQPGQIGVRDEHPVLLGLGTARRSGGPRPPISEDPGYQAPERCLGARPDPRMDLFSLGAVLYELATGRPPFPAEEPAPVRARALRPRLPLDLDVAIHALLEHDPGRRPQTALDVLRLLVTALSGGEARAWPAFADALLDTG
jgi:eukaryotic-like serine/threonine-protein kinase